MGLLLACTNPMHLAGLDIGFSKTRASNALALFRDGELTVSNLTVFERDAALRDLETVDVLAIDAPILPPGTPPDFKRSVEQFFSRGLYQTRCKPGMSHVAGTGQTLREHGRIAAELAMHATRSTDERFAQVIPGSNIVEAFPNTFLAVCLSNADFAERPQLARGGKFDWLYDRWIARGLFERAVDAASLPPNVSRACVLERDHDRRAALVCLLTAAFAHLGTATVIGDQSGGYFFLPPRGMWEEWKLNAPSQKEVEALTAPRRQSPSNVVSFEERKARWLANARDFSVSTLPVEVRRRILAETLCEPDKDEIVEEYLDATNDEVAADCAEIVPDVLRTMNANSLFTPQEIETLIRLATAANVAAICRRKLGLD